MLYIVFFAGIVAGFALFLTNMLLKAAQENDAQRLVLLEEEIEHEKEQRQFYRQEQQRFKRNREGIDQQLLHIRLDLLNTDDDLKDVIPKLLHNS